MDFPRWRPPPTARSAVWLSLIGTRLPVLLLGALAVTLIGTVPAPTAEALWRVSPNELVNLQARWDTDFYHQIATTGYQWDRSVFLHQNVVFFPLYPLLMRWGGALLGGHPLLAGTIVSLAAFAGAIVVLYRLAALELGEDKAWPVILLVSTYPFALFYSVVYTESLFLLLTVGAFYAMRRRHLLLAALCGVAAGLARPNGFWLALPLLWLAASAPSSPPDDATSPLPWWRDRRRVAAILAALAPLAGTAIFSAYLYGRFGDALAWMHGQAAWGMPLLGRGPAPDPVRTAEDLRVKVSEVLVYVGDITAFFWAATSILPVTRRLGIAYGLWIAVNIFPPVAAHLFISLGRFTAVLFPLFFWLALVVPRRRLTRVAVAFAVCQAILAVGFFLWRPVV
ncbi:MAG TPA: mannosyltransferase family protein [Gemmatimonadales bacterium]|nr:mannosyltransferase family protein [Gemmatimonadales bacterium]